MASYTTRIKAFFAPPVFPGDEDKTRRAKVLNTLLLTIMLFLIFTSSFLVPFVFVAKLYNGLFLLALFLVSAVAYGLMRRGHVRRASATLSWGLWIVFTVYLPFAGGITSIAVVFYVAGNVIAGLLLGTRATLMHTAACSLTGLGMVILEASGHSLPRLFPIPAPVGWVDMTIGLLLTTTVMSLVLRSLNDALALARQRLEERVQAESQREAALEALRESEAKFRGLVESSSDWIWEGNTEGVYTYVSPKIKDILGYKPQEVIGKTSFDLMPPEEAQRVGKVFKELVARGKPMVRLQNVNLHKDGHPVVLETSGVPILDAAGKVRGYRGVDRDITERAQAESQRKAVLEALHESEEKYRLLAETTRDIILLHDMDGRILYLNQAGLDFAGFERSDTIGRSIADFVPAKHQVGLATRRAQRAAGDAQTRLYQAEFMNRNGQRVPFEVHSTPILREGDVSKVLVVARDVTERVQAESQREAALKERERLANQVREQARQMEQVLATVPAGVLLLDAQGLVLQANPAAESDLADLAHVRVGEVLTHLGNRPLAELLALPPTQGLWHEVKAGSRTFEVIARSAENSPVPEHWVLVVNDVTQEREVRKQLEQQERLAAVGQLAAGIAHDFNNIMAAIILYARMIERAEGLSDRGRERLSVINQQAWHATRLIEQILDFSRRAVLERRPLDLLPLLKEQVKLLKRTLPEHIEIDLAYGPDEYTVHADPTRMQQMLTNLAVNARDVMPDGGTFRVQLERITAEQEGWIRLTVSDTGTGIVPDVLPHIFEPFFTTKEPGQGSGLGLAQVHGIVGQHGGRIDVTTEVGQGTTFTIDLPALAVRPTENPLPDVSAMPAGQGEVVLVVEDGEAVRAALIESLEELNYQTLQAANGQKALAMIETQGEQIALVLSDVVMPGIGGKALFHALRQRGWQTPLILLTGHPLDKELEALQNEGLSAWLTKPPTLEQLAQAVAGALRE